MSRVNRFVKSSRFSFYGQMFLSSWGDRMWHFATGVLLTSLTGSGSGVMVTSSVNLKLAALYGFCSCIATILFGSLIGGWIDKARRRRAALTCVFVQNSFVALSAAAICCGIARMQTLVDTRKSDESDALLIFFQVVAILFAVAADLASAGLKISISKDWLVVVYGGDKRKLTEINASLRRIDLTCHIISPMICGVVMQFVSLLVAAICIAGWNLLSMVFECFILLRIYRLNPPLAKVKTSNTVQSRSKFVSTLNRRIAKGHGATASNRTSSVRFNAELAVAAHDAQGEEITHLSPVDTNADSNRDSVSNAQPAVGSQHTKVGCGLCCLGCILQSLDGALGMFRGWHAYSRQPCLLTGIALALLYANAICYDQVMVGYALSQLMPEIVISAIGGAISLTGIAGTFLFPVLRTRCGLTLTCLIGLFLEFIALLPCVASIWTAGSPFNPSFQAASRNLTGNQSAAISESNLFLNFTDGSYATDTPVSFNASIFNLETLQPGVNGSAFSKQPWDSAFLNPSLILLICGIVLSRVGLWCADLTISQIYLEVVPETERGKVNGVQFSLDKVAEMSKYILVLVFPYPEQFGFLILISVSAIAVSVICAAFYAGRNTQKIRAELLEEKAKRGRPVDANRANDQ